MPAASRRIKAAPGLLARPLDHLAKPGQTRRRAGKQVRRERSMLEDVGVNAIARVQVEAQACQVLKPEIAIAVDGRPAEPVGELGRAASVAREQLRRRKESD